MKKLIAKIRAQLLRDLAAARAAHKGERGMTLVEIMVVVIIISLVTGVVGVQVFNSLAKAKEKVAGTQIKEMSNALDVYKLSFHQYPSTAEGLNVLVAPKSGKPFMNSIPKDPWDREYVYIYPGVQNPNGFDIMSYGEDGVQGGGDDIGNWAMQAQN